jgi:hypothetical protein
MECEQVPFENCFSFILGTDINSGDSILVSMESNPIVELKNFKNLTEIKDEGFVLVKHATIISARAPKAATHKVFNQIPLVAELVAGGGQVLLEVNKNVDRDEMLAYDVVSMPPMELGLDVRHLKLDEMVGTSVGCSVLFFELEATHKDQVTNEMHTKCKGAKMLNGLMEHSFSFQKCKLMKLQAYKEWEGSFAEPIWRIPMRTV